jgi:ABC-type sugar transport system substrate-binding protein
MKIKSKGRFISAFAIAASLALTACGSDTAEEAVDTTAAEVEETEATPKPELTIGYLQILSQSEAAMRLQNDTKAAADLFGWGFDVCDAQGTVEGMQTCGDKFVNQGVDVIITNGTPSVVILAQLEAAKAKGIPFINTGGTQATPEDYTASYNPNDGLMGKVLGEWIAANATPGEVLVHSVKDKWGADREASFMEVIKGTKFAVVDTVDTPFDNTLVGFTQTAAAGQFTKFPKATVLWLTFDLAALGAGPAIAASYPGKTPPDRPLVATFYCNSTTQAEMRKGTVDVCVETPLEAGTWIAIDQIASHFAKGTEFSAERQPTYDGVQFDVPIVVTPETLPAEGTYPTPVGDFRTYFTNKWKTEYGL